MMLTLTDADLKQAITDWVRKNIQEDGEIQVVRITRHQGGKASADVEVTHG